MRRNNETTVIRNVAAKQQSRPPPSPDIDRPTTAESTTSTVDSLDYPPTDTGLPEFLRLRREHWKVRLGSMKVNRRLLKRTFEAWRSFKDFEPKLSKEQMAQQNLVQQAEKERLRRMVQVPKPYYGANALARDYIIEPKVKDWKSLLWTELVPDPKVNLLEPVDPLPFQLPLSKNEMYKVAIDRGHATYLRQLLNYRQEDPGTFDPLLVSYALGSGFPAVYKVMIEFGIDPNGICNLPYTKTRTPFGRCTEMSTHLHRAAHRGDLELMRMLLDHGANVDPQNRLGRTPLHLACSTLESAIFLRVLGDRVHPASLLIARGASPHSTDHRLTTPLHLACLSGDAIAATLLVASGASVLAEDDSFKLPYELAPKNLTLKVLSCLRNALKLHGREGEYSAMFAKSAARVVFRRVISVFSITCKVCGRRVTTCNHNRRSKFSYWAMTHKFVPRDCSLEVVARKSGLRDAFSPIPDGFSSPWNGPLYDAPSIIFELERRKIPANSRVGVVSPHVDLSNNFDSMGNLSLDRFYNPVLAEKRRSNALSLQKKRDKMWAQLTFAERKEKIKYMNAQKEIARLKRVEIADDEDEDEDEDDNEFKKENEGGVDDGGGGRAARKTRATVSKPKFLNDALDLARQAIREAELAEASLLEADGGPKREPRKSRKTRSTFAWDPDGKEKTAQKKEKERDSGGRSETNRNFRGSRKTIKFLSPEQIERRSRENWIFLRKRLKPASRVLLRQQLMRDPANLAYMVRLGMACVDTGPNTPSALHRMAALLMQKAVVLGFDPHSADGGAGLFWKRYAQAHTKCWEAGGGFIEGGDDPDQYPMARGRERLHLEFALQGWEQALQHIYNSTDHTCWAAAAQISQRLGDYSTAANVLGSLIRQFPQRALDGSVAITASSILAELGQFEQAVMYLHQVVVSGPPPPLTPMHMTFFMARLYERWSNAPVDKDGNPPPSDAQSQARGGYERCFEYLSKTGGMLFNSEWASENDWAQAQSTWHKYGDVASSAGQYLFACDFYAEGLRRQPPKPLRPQPYVFLSRSYSRAGKIAAAIESLETAIQVAKKVKLSEQAATYAQQLEKLRNPSNHFEEELDSDVMDILDRYDAAIPSDGVLRQIPKSVLAQSRAVELKASRSKRSKKTAFHWAAVRDRLKGAARRFFQMKLLDAPEGAVNGRMLAKMGILCVDSGPKSSSQLDRCAAIILQKAADSGYDGDPAEPNSAAEFWLNFARAHFRVWSLDGVRAERIHLVRSSYGWEKALSHVRVACDVSCWREAATAMTCLGDYSRAAQTLGVLAKSFPKYPQINFVRLDTAILLFQLRSYEQAVNFLNMAMSSSRLPPPLTHSDLLFFMARIYYKWADEEEEEERLANQGKLEAAVDDAGAEGKEGENKRRLKGPEGDAEGSDSDSDRADRSDTDSDVTEQTTVSEKRREYAYDSLRSVYDSLVNAGGLKNKKSSYDFDDWRRDPLTFQEFGARAVDAGKNLLAVDLYNKAISLLDEDEDDDEDDEKTTEKIVAAKRGKVNVIGLWFGLAKAHSRCGQMEDAIRACKEALSCKAARRSTTTQKIAGLLAHWEALSSGFEEEVNSDLPVLFDRYMSNQGRIDTVDFDSNCYAAPITDTVALRERTIVARYRRIMGMDGVETSLTTEAAIHNVEDIEKILESRRKWKCVRRNIRSKAREEVRRRLLHGLRSLEEGKPEDECGPDIVQLIARMGLHCAAEKNGPNCTVSMMIGASVLMRKALNYVYCDIVKRIFGPQVGEAKAGRLWKELAWCHWRIYDLQGRGCGKGERDHLEQSLIAAHEALKYVSVVNDGSFWVMFATASASRGDYGSAISLLQSAISRNESIMTTTIAIQCATYSKALGLYTQAISYLFSAISAGPEGPYDAIDMAFLMSWFLQEQTATHESSTNRGSHPSSGDVAPHSDQKPCTFEGVFNMISKLEDPKRKNYEDVASWLADHITWLEYADIAASAENYALSSELYLQAYSRLHPEDREGHVKVCFKLSKSLRKCGQFDQALLMLDVAITHASNATSAHSSPKDIRKVNSLKGFKLLWGGSGEATRGGRGPRRTRTAATSSEETGSEENGSASISDPISYRIALMMPVKAVLETFVKPPAERMEDLELKSIRALMELKSRNGRWKHLRRRLKEAARIDFAKTLVKTIRATPSSTKKAKILKGILDPEDVLEIERATGKGGYASPARNTEKLSKELLAARDEVTVSLNMLATMGKLCHDSSSTNPSLHRCASVLLQRAADSGYVGDGDFWRRLARSHFRAYITAGVTGEREHLHLSSIAWDKAFEHLDSASRVECWIDASNVRIHMGDFTRATQTLAVIARSFPHFQGLNSISLTACSVLLKMGNWEQARAYMYDCMSRGAPSPFTQIDLTFYMARIYEKWAEDASLSVSSAEHDNLVKTASTAYMAVYSNLKETKSPLVMDPENGVDKQFKVWLESASTWRWFGEKACLGNNFILGGFMYEQALKRDKSLQSQHLRTILCFGLAKCNARVGAMRVASDWLLEALKGANSYGGGEKQSDSAQMQVILNAWENPVSSFSEEMALPIPKLLAGFSLISPSAATTPAATPRTPRGDDVTPRRNTAQRTPRDSPRGSDGSYSYETPSNAPRIDLRVTELWSKCRRSIVKAATDKLTEDLKLAPEKSIFDLVYKLASLALNKNPQLAAAAMQSLANKGYTGGKNPAEFYERLAQSHTAAWYGAQGKGTTSVHLISSKKAWAKSLTHLGSAANPACWAQSVAVLVTLGKFGEGSDQLGTLVRSFPQIDSDALAVIALTASTLLAEMRQFDQASSYLYDAIEKGPVYPFNQTHLSFFVARLNERWGGGSSAERAYQSQLKSTELGAEPPQMFDDDGRPVPFPGTERCELMRSKRLASSEGYLQAFIELKSARLSSFQAMNTEGFTDVVNWLLDAKTWQCFAEAAVISNMPVLACDLYKQCVKRNNTTHGMWVHLAKAQRQVGNIDAALTSLAKAESIAAAKGGSDAASMVSNLSFLSRWVKFWKADKSDIEQFETSGQIKSNILLKRRLNADVRQLFLGSSVLTLTPPAPVKSPSPGDAPADAASVIVRPPVNPLPKSERRKNDRKEQVRALLWNWIKAGIKHAARIRILERIQQIKGVGEESMNMAALGILCMRTSRNKVSRLAALLLDRAKLLGFDGNDVEGGAIRERSSSNPHLLSMEKVLTTARFRRALAEAHSLLAEKSMHAPAHFSSGVRSIDVPCIYHANYALSMYRDAAQCDENSVSPSFWVGFTKALVRCGLLDEAVEKCKILLEMPNLKSRGSIAVLSASILLQKGGLQNIRWAKDALGMALQDPKSSGFTKADLAFLFAYITKLEGEFEFEKSDTDGRVDVTTFSDLSLTLFDSLHVETKKLQPPKLPPGPKVAVEIQQHDEVLAPTRAWLGDFRTWAKMAKRCEAADQLVFASIFNQFAFNLLLVADRETKDVKVAMKIITTYQRLGQARDALYFFQSVMPKGFKNRVQQYVNVSSTSFITEYERSYVSERKLGNDFYDVIGPYDLFSVTPSKLPTRPRVFFEKWASCDTNVAARWQQVRLQMRPAARSLAIKQALASPKDAKQLAALGMLCVSGNGGDFETLRCGCLLMQAAADLDYAGNANFWSKLAKTHIELWHGTAGGMGGGGGERGHLIRADKAFGEALKHFSNASDVFFWIAAANAKTCLGDYQSASIVLSTLLRNLGSDVSSKNIPQIVAVKLSAVELSIEIGAFEQADIYVNDLIASGKHVSLLSNVDYLFILGRLHTKWSEDLLKKRDGRTFSSANFHSETSRAAYSSVFKMCIENGDTTLGITGNMVNADEWLDNWTPWFEFGNRAALSRHYLLAADFYREGLKRDEAASITKFHVWFALAKALRRCGRLEESLGAARKAVEIWKGRGSLGEAVNDGAMYNAAHMQSAIEMWEADELGGANMFDDELGKGAAHWIDVYLTTKDDSLNVEGARVETRSSIVERRRTYTIREHKKIVKLKGVRANSWVSATFGDDALNDNDNDNDNDEEIDEDSIMIVEAGDAAAKTSSLWYKFRRGIVTLALKIAAKQLFEVSTDRTHGMHQAFVTGLIVRVGLLCAAHRHVSAPLARAGARLLQAAIDDGVFNKGENAKDVGEAEGNRMVNMSRGRRALVWRRLAESHAVVAASEGFGREAERWAKSREAWKAAMAFIECGTDIHCWESNVHVCVQLGDFAEAARTLTVLLKSFKLRAAAEGSARTAGEGKGGAFMKLLAGSLQMKLGNHQVAHSFVVGVLEGANEQRKSGSKEMGGVGHVAPPAPLTDVHLMFISARLYEMWGSHGGGEGPKRVAVAGYKKCFAHLLGANDHRALEAVEKEGHATWLQNPETWRKYANDFQSAGLSIFACELMTCAMLRLPKEKGQHYGNAAADFWLEAAFMNFNAGLADESRNFLMQAVKMDPNNRRAEKNLTLLNGGHNWRKAANPSLKSMQKKSMDQVCTIILGSEIVKTITGA